GTGALGLLGEQDLDASIARAKAFAGEYQVLTDEPVVPAFEIIVTIASAGAGDDGQYSRRLPPESFVPWVEAARDAGVYVVLDLQPGRTDFLTQAKQYEALLRYPNVGLALDPEWRLEPDQVHLRQIGSVGIDEVNTVVTWLADLTREHALPQKLLVLHQFSLRMISERERLDTSRDELSLMIHVDGQGTQPAKQGTWRTLRAGAPDVWWGWKNFVDEDLPMLTPTQTYEQVDPLPQLVTYQQRRAEPTSDDDDGTAVVGRRQALRTCCGRNARAARSAASAAQRATICGGRLVTCASSDAEADRLTA